MRKIFDLILVLLIAINLVGCNDKQGRYISTIIPLAEKKPDSALALLKKVDQTKLSEKAVALYSIAYTMAQDKSGIDVDNDSLLRNAYNWYNGKPADSLYAAVKRRFVAFPILSKLQNDKMITIHKVWR